MLPCYYVAALPWRWVGGILPSWVVAEHLDDYIAFLNSCICSFSRPHNCIVESHWVDNGQTHCLIIMSITNSTKLLGLRTITLLTGQFTLCSELMHRQANILLNSWDVAGLGLDVGARFDKLWRLGASSGAANIFLGF